MAITRIEQKNAYSDLVLSHLFSQYQLEKNDKALTHEIVKGVVKYKRKLDSIIVQLVSKKVDDTIRYILWIGLYQLLFLSRIPDFAAINESVTLSKKYKKGRFSGFVNAVLRNFLRQKDSILDEIKKDIADFYSFPDWMVNNWVKQFGVDETKQLCESLNKPPHFSFRVNRLTFSQNDCIKYLETNSIEYQIGIIDNFIRVDDFNLIKPLVDEGKITIQDESAGLVSLLANPQNGDLVFDLCASPGGKTMHLSELGDIKVISGDLNFSRTKLIAGGVERLERKNVLPIVADAQNFPSTLADIVMLDAPCSGFGVMNKKPDIRWRKNPTDLKQLNKLQITLIEKAKEYVKHGGHLIYSTCTFEKSENDDVVEQFLTNNSNFVIEPPNEKIPVEVIEKNMYIKTYPHKNGMDGSFSVKLKRIS